jgi:hypothetical protein
MASSLARKLKQEDSLRSSALSDLVPAAQVQGRYGMTFENSRVEGTIFLYSVVLGIVRRREDIYATLEQ